MTASPRQIGARIRARRLALDLTMSEAARQAGWQRQRWYGPEAAGLGGNRSSTPTVATLERVALVLGSTIDDLARKVFSENRIFHLSLQARAPRIR